MDTVAVARNAMATRFEIVLYGDNPASLRAAAEEALDEIERLDAQLSLYRPESEISHVNARAAHEPVRIGPSLFRLLRQVQRLNAETGGAFDITVAPLMRCWGFMHGTGRLPATEEIAEARSRVGMNLVELNQTDFTVRFVREGVMLDLGSIGKGFALERAAEFLFEAGVTRAILHGGTSTVCAIGSPPDADAWKVGVPRPGEATQAGLTSSDQSRRGIEGKLLSVVPLKDAALSVSAVWGKAFEAEGRTYGHVIDPRRGIPVDGAVMAAVVLPSATETDALSTALLVLGEAGHDRIAGLRPGIQTLVVGRGSDRDGYTVAGRGIEPVTST
jgi:thiamine biosynthesis lipoprotein